MAMQSESIDLVQFFPRGFFSLSTASFLQYYSIINLSDNTSSLSLSDPSHPIFTPAVSNVSTAALLPLSLLPPLSRPPLPLSTPRGLLIDCGADVSSTINDRPWLVDTDYISTGSPRLLTTLNLAPTLSTVRSFPLLNNIGRKFCYVVPVYRPATYLIRTTYFYGGINGPVSPPVFDQIIDGTFWSVVNTTEDYARGNPSYYEGVFSPGGNTMSVCVAPNSYTESDPFISALEFVILGNSLYNSTDFSRNGLRLIARNSFGYNGPVISYPDDQFDRRWAPFGANNPTTTRGQNVALSGFWNLPPLKVFETQLAASQPGPLELQWPPLPLPNSTYYIALYFAEDSGPSSGVSSVFNISVNGIIYIRDLNVVPSGVVVFANQWPLAGLTNITLSPALGSSVAPSINAGEIFEVVPLPLVRRTLTRDVISLESLTNSFQNPPFDWRGDPCLPRQYSWTGVTCSEGSRIRVISLNLTGMSLSGSLSPSIANLTALTDIWLGNNNLSGPVPQLSTLTFLQTVHLEDNQLSGEIPASLGNIASLRELFLQNNNLTGQVPSSLTGKPGLNLRISPGNPLLSPPPL